MQYNCTPKYIVHTEEGKRFYLLDPKAAYDEMQSKTKEARR